MIDSTAGAEPVPGAEPVSPTPTIDELVTKVAEAIRGQDGERVLANLYGPMVRRLTALEDLLVHLANKATYGSPELYHEVSVAMVTLGFTRSTDGSGWVKSNSGL